MKALMDLAVELPQGKSILLQQSTEKTDKKGHKTKDKNRRHIIRVKDQAAYTYFRAVGAIANQKIRKYNKSDANVIRAKWLQFFQLVALAPYGWCERFIAEDWDYDHQLPIYATIQHIPEEDAETIQKICQHVKTKNTEVVMCPRAVERL
jgi:hypothetical protein